MFIFHIFNSFETEGHCTDQRDFHLLKTIVLFNSGKINMKKTRITIIIYHEKPVCPRLRCRNVTA